MHELIPYLIKLVKFHELSLYIPKSVFNPLIALSTDMIIKYLNHLELEGTIVDFGCGSGVIAIYIAKQFNKEVYCIDISLKSLAAAKVNSIINDVLNKVKVMHFTKVSVLRGVELIVTNPPYLPLDPIDDLDINWCAGKDLRYLKAIINSCNRLLRNGGFLIITISTLTNVKYVLRYLLSNFRLINIDYVRTPFDTILLLHLIKSD